MPLSTRCSIIAATLDAHLEANGWGGLFFNADSARPWWHLACFRDPQHGLQHRPGWTLHVGRWELVRDGQGPIVTVWGVGNP